MNLYSCFLTCQLLIVLTMSRPQRSMSRHVKPISTWAGPLTPTGSILMAADPLALSKSAATWQVCVCMGGHEITVLCHVCEGKCVCVCTLPYSVWCRHSDRKLQRSSFLTLNTKPLKLLCLGFPWQHGHIYRQVTQWTHTDTDTYQLMYMSNTMHTRVRTHKEWNK